MTVISFTLLLLQTFVLIKEYECVKCGITQNTISSYIVGGEILPAHYFPWMALMVIKRNIKDGRCGGSIISNQWILTAGHCIDDKDGGNKFLSFKIILGEHDVNETDGMEVYARDVQIIRHEGYSKETLHHDIALVKMNIKLDFKRKHKHLMPICLPTHSTKRDDQSCRVAGWGLTEDEGTTPSSQLKVARLPIFSEEYCDKAWSDDYNPERQICAGDSEGNEDSCVGDSGGPLVCERAKNVWVQHGIVSFGEKCAQKDKPGIYTNVLHYIPWIEEQTGINFH